MQCYKENFKNKKIQMESIKDNKEKETKQILTEKQQQRKLIESKVNELLQEDKLQDMVRNYILDYLKNSKFSQQLITDSVNELAKRIEFKVTLK